MARSCNLSYRIENGSIIDIADLGFHLVKSDDRIIAPIRDYEIQEYPETPAAEIHPYTTSKPFDYTVKLLAFGDESSVNASVRAFWDSLFDSTVSPKMAHPITLYNHWKGVMLTGYPKSTKADSSYPILTECESSAYIFDLVFYIADPATLITL